MEGTTKPYHNTEKKTKKNMFYSLPPFALNISVTRSVQSVLTYDRVMLHATMLKKYEKYRHIS